MQHEYKSNNSQATVQESYATMADQVVVYEHPVSPYAQSVKIALREKGIDFKLVLPSVLGGSTPDTFKIANPRAEVPAFIHGNATLFETSIILEYINDTWPSPPLFPADPIRKADASLAAHVALTQYEALMWACAEIRLFKRAEGALAAKLERNIQTIATELQTWLEQKLGDSQYFSGLEFGYADICITPLINSSIGSGLGPDKNSKLSAWLQRVKERSSVRITFDEAKAGLAKMTALGDISKRPSTFKREYRDHRLDLMIRIGGIGVVTEGLKKDNVRFSWPDVVREKL